jgi:hypothetical protein
MVRDWDDDIDAPQEMDLEAEGPEVDTVDCPACGESIPEDLARCPCCGQWIVGDTPAGRRSRGWVWPVMVAFLVALILVLWHGLGR